MSNLYDDYIRQNPIDEEYLEHYGVKGMKWGVRKGDKNRASNPQGSGDATAAQKQKRRKTAMIAGGVGAAVAIAAGSAYVGRQTGIRSAKISSLNAGPSFDSLFKGQQWMSALMQHNNWDEITTEVMARSYDQHIRPMLR